VFYGGKEATVGVTLDLGFALPTFRNTYYTPPLFLKGAIIQFFGIKV